MKIIAILPLILTLFFNNSLSQVNRISFQVISKETGKPVPYVNLGLVGKPIGTNSDENGQINFLINQTGLEDSDRFVISSVGYKSLKMTFSELDTIQVIKLEEQAEELKEIVIKAQKTYPKILGKDNKGALTHLMIYGVNNSIDDGLSQEFGIIINSNKSCIINSFNFYLSSNNFEHLKFRFHLYEYNDSIQSNLLNEDIYFNIEPEYVGWTKVDLTPYNIVIPAKDFIATAQLIELKQLNDKPRLTMPIVTPSIFHGFVYRDKNQSDWKINKSANPSIYLDANCSNN